MSGVAPPVRRGVPVRGSLSDLDMTAAHTQPKVHPLAADPQAVLATEARRLNVANGVKVSTGIGHHYSADLTAFWLFGGRSRAARSQAAVVAAASYVLCRKDSSTRPGSVAVRTTSYGRTNSPSCSSYLASVGRTLTSRKPTGSG